MVPQIILIAPADALAALQQQPYLRDAQAFVDPDRAWEAIRDLKPHRVAVERGFADTPPGQTFVKRIKSDPALVDCDVMIVGVRRAPRHKLSDAVSILVEGNHATLHDISTIGAHVVCGSTLRPQQRVRVSLAEGERPVRGIVVWASFEIPKEGPRYRAGIEFGASAEETVSQFILNHLDRD